MKDLQPIKHNPTIPVVRNNWPQQRKSGSKTCLVFRGIATFIQDTSRLERAAIITAIGLQIIFPALAPAVWVFSCTALVTRLVVKVIGSYNTIKIRKFSFFLFQLEKYSPKIKAVFMIIAIAAGIFCLPVGIILGSLVGVYIGLISPFVRQLEKQEAEKKMPDEIQQDRLLEISRV